MREGGGNCLKYLKRGWNRKEGRENKDLKNEGQAMSRGGCLNEGRGTGIPLQTKGSGHGSYILCSFKFVQEGKADRGT